MGTAHVYMQQGVKRERGLFAVGGETRVTLIRLSGDAEF